MVSISLKLRILDTECKIFILISGTESGKDIPAELCKAAKNIQGQCSDVDELHITKSELLVQVF